MSLVWVPIACNEADENPLAERISDAEAAALPTPGRLAQALLSPDDMPEGWFELRIPPNNDDPCEISLARAAGLASDRIPIARTVLAGDRAGPVLGEFIEVLPDGRGPGALDQLTADIRECDSDMAAGVRYTTRPLQIGRLGDQSVAVRFELEREELQFDATQDTVYVRVDDTFVAVSVLTLGDPATGQNPMLEAWARQAVDKVQRVLELS